MKKRVFLICAVLFVLVFASCASTPEATGPVNLENTAWRHESGHWAMIFPDSTNWYFENSQGRKWVSGTYEFIADDNLIQMLVKEVEPAGREVGFDEPGEVYNYTISGNRIPYTQTHSGLRMYYQRVNRWRGQRFD